MSVLIRDSADNGKTGGALADAPPFCSLGGPPFGRALLSMPVRLLRRPTSTALRTAFRSRSAVDARSFLRRNEHGPAGRHSVAAGAGGPSHFAAKRGMTFSSSFPPALLPSPARFCREKSPGHEACLPQTAGGGLSAASATSFFSTSRRKFGMLPFVSSPSQAGPPAPARGRGQERRAAAGPSATAGGACPPQR